jgi:protein O-mannosyl-transferase
MDVTTNESGPAGGISIGGFGLKRVTLLALLAFLAGGLALYWNALSFEFLNYDDAFYVRDNPHLSAGFSWKSVRWALETNLLRGDRSAEYWMPLTMFSRLVDAELFGTNGGLHHLQNILFHALNAWLIFLVLADLTGALGRSALVAALFLVHPINAEVVSWIALRKDVLAGTFSLLTIFMYVRFVRKPTLLRYLGALGVFGGAILCKPSVVALPLALLLIDWWPLNRLRLRAPDNVGRRKFLSVLVVLAEKLPFLILALVASLVTFVGQRDLGLAAIRGDQAYSVEFGRTAAGYLDYVRRVFLVDPFCVLYPMRPWDAISRSDLWNAGVFVVGITLGTVLLALRRYRPPLMGWLWFVGLLLPVSGLVQFGRQATADRYMYLPLIGLLIFFVWLFADFLAFRRLAQVAPLPRWRSVTVGAVSLAIVGLLALQTRAQALTWRSDTSLWTQAMLVETDSAVAFNNFGSALTGTGQDKAAENYLRASLKISHSVEQTGNVGRFLARYGDPEAAVPYLERAIKADPSQVENHRWLVYALLRAKKADMADLANGRYEQVRGRIFLLAGLDYLENGDAEDARMQFSLALTALIRARKFSHVGLDLLPSTKWLPFARDWLLRLPAHASSVEDRRLIQGYLSYLAGDISSAARLFGAAAAHQPQLAEPHWRRAICLAELGQTEAADLEAAAARVCPVAFEEGSSDWLFLRGEKDGSPTVAP